MVDTATLQELESLLPALRNWAKKYSTVHYESEEIVSDTILRFLENGSYNPASGSLRNYLFSAIRNRAFDASRKHDREYQRLFREYLEFRSPTLDHRGPPAEVCYDEFEKMVLIEIEKIRGLTGIAFRMFAIEGLDYVTIASRMGKTDNHVKNMIFHARRIIRSTLADYLIEGV